MISPLAIFSSPFLGIFYRQVLEYRAIFYWQIDKIRFCFFPLSHQCLKIFMLSTFSQAFWWGWQERLHQKTFSTCCPRIWTSISCYLIWLNVTNFIGLQRLKVKYYKLIKHKLKFMKTFKVVMYSINFGVQNSLWISMNWIVPLPWIIP